MRIRSKPLYDYLQRAGVLNGTPEELALAKKQYRKLYKREYKQRNRPRKEIRFEVTFKQYQIIKAIALSIEARPTTYCRQVILSTVETTPLISRRDMLLQVLQLVSMAINTLNRSTTPHTTITYLEQAEQLLLQYLNIKN